MKVYKFLTAVFLLGISVSCQTNTYDEIGGYVDNPSYQKNIKPIFDSQCTTCHYQGNTTTGAGIEIYDYQTTRDNVEFGSVLRDIDSTHTMPKSAAPLSKTKIKLIYQWKNTGFQQ